MTTAGETMRETLERLLGHAVRSVRVRRSQYSTSFPIDELDVVLASGARLSLVRKDLAWSSLLPAAVSGKPRFLHDPRREMRVYTEVLAHAPAGTAECIGVVDEGDDGRRWLVLEKVAGVELFQVGDIERWVAAARWAAALHRGFAGAAVDHLVHAGIPLLVHDEQWVQRWAQRALSAASGQRAAHIARACAVVPWATERLRRQPRTLVHGEMYASNIIVGPPGPDVRVCPIDWEMAAVAPALVDLAALTAGKWPNDARVQIEDAYFAAAGLSRNVELEADLDACRLAMSLQWLGWMPGWCAPADHAHDWLSDAVAIAERIT